MRPWNDWYHVTGHTYGTWLPGDPRGWRSRDHREHVEGDYRNPPPPGTDEKLHEWSKDHMKRAPVLLDRRAQDIACDALAAKLVEKWIEVVAVAVDDRHFHLVARFPDHQPRRWVGLAKKNSAWALVDAGLADRGGVWALRPLCKPITDASHFQNAVNYVADHSIRGAAVWMTEAVRQAREARAKSGI